MLDYLTGWRQQLWCVVLALLVLALAADVLFVVFVVGMVVCEW
jgi:hypothetical protein